MLRRKLSIRGGQGGILNILIKSVVLRQRKPWTAKRVDSSPVSCSDFDKSRVTDLISRQLLSVCVSVLTVLKLGDWCLSIPLLAQEKSARHALICLAVQFPCHAGPYVTKHKEQSTKKKEQENEMQRESDRKETRMTIRDPWISFQASVTLFAFPNNKSALYYVYQSRTNHIL